MKTILEVGTGSVPYFVRYEIPWLIGDEYISIDMDEGRMEKAKQELSLLSSRGKTCPQKSDFKLGDGINLEIESASCDMVVLSNVLTAPIHHLWDEQGRNMEMKNKSGVYRRRILQKEGEKDPFYTERKAVIEECVRMLRPGGTLLIYTDLLVYGANSYNRLINELRGDMSLVFENDTIEAERIDELNKKKLASRQFCYCFDADVLPNSHVLKFTKIY